MATTETNNKELDISIFDSATRSVKEITGLERIDTEMAYIPPKAFETLLIRAKRSATEETNLLRERAEIELAYANSLKIWRSSYVQKFEKEYSMEYPEVAAYIKTILNEGNKTANRHERIANQFTLSDGPLTQIQSFLSTEIANVRPTTKHASKDAVSTRFDQSIADYHHTIELCLSDLRNALKSKQSEDCIAAFIKEKEDLFNEIADIKESAGGGSNPKLMRDLFQIETKLQLARPRYDAAQSKRRGHYCKAKHRMHMSLREVEQLKLEIASWEKKRLELTCAQFEKALDIICSNLMIQQVGRRSYHDVNESPRDVSDTSEVISKSNKSPVNENNQNMNVTHKGGDIYLNSTPEMCKNDLDLCEFEEYSIEVASKPTLDSIIEAWKHNSLISFAASINTMQCGDAQVPFFKKEHAPLVTRRVSTKLRPRNWLKNVYGTNNTSTQVLKSKAIKRSQKSDQAKQYLLGEIPKGTPMQVPIISFRTRSETDIKELMRGACPVGGDTIDGEAEEEVSMSELVRQTAPRRSEMILADESAKKFPKVDSEYSPKKYSEPSKRYPILTSLRSDSDTIAATDVTHSYPPPYNSYNSAPIQNNKRVGKTMYATCDMNGSVTERDQADSPPNSLAVRKGQPIVMQRYFMEKNLGYGYVKRSSASVKKYGYFPLSKMAAAKPRAQ